MYEYEIGYTPANLRILLEKHCLTQQQIAAAMGVADVTVRRWLMPVTANNHRPMSHLQWLALLDIIGEDVGN